MATTTDELLAAAEASATETSDIDYLVIDNDTRTITIPSSVKLLGVESDDEVTRLYFKMPAIYGEFDLSEFEIRINYMNAKNTGDTYLVDDAAVDGDYITFSWLVGRVATEYKGKVSFIVCLKLVDDNGTVEKEFNTTLATLNVLEGLETTEAVVSENPDVIEQILKMIASIDPDAVDGSGISTLALDTTLTQEGYAADAKAVGDAISEVSDKIDNLDTGSGTVKSVNGVEPDSSGNVEVEFNVDETVVTAAVETWLDENPDATTTVQDGSITADSLSDALREELGLDKAHHLTEVEIELTQCVYQGWEDSGTWVKTVPFLLPQYIRVVTDYAAVGVTDTTSQYYTYYSMRWCDADGGTDTTGDSLGDFGISNWWYYPDGSGVYTNVKNPLVLDEDGNEADFTIPIRAVVDNTDYSGLNYVQYQFSTTSALYRNTAGLHVYAIYDDYRVTYDVPDDTNSDLFYIEDLKPIKWMWEGGNVNTVRPFIWAVVPYYPSMTYYIKGGCIDNSLSTSFIVYALFDDFDFENSYHPTFTANYVSNFSSYGALPFQYRFTAGSAFVDGYTYSDPWSVFTTPPENVLSGPKYLAFCTHYQTAIATHQSEVTEEMETYLNSCLETWTDQYITRFNNILPRRPYVQYKFPNPNYDDYGTLYKALIATSENPLYGSDWVLFGDSLTDNYGGDDESSDYFAGKIAREFGMTIHNYAASGGNINIGEAYTGGVTLLEQYITDYENGDAPYPDYITVAYGSNGYTSNLGTIDNTSEDTNKCYGATRYFIERINEVFPNAVLGFVLPPRSSWSADDGCTAPNAAKDISATREAIREVIELEEYGGIPYIDMSKESGITFDMLPDCIHISSDEAQNKYYHAMRRFMMSL